MSHMNHLSHPQESIDEILKVIKSPNIHFNIQETQHLVYITICKKFVIEPSRKVFNQLVADQKFANLEKPTTILNSILMKKWTTTENLRIL